MRETTDTIGQIMGPTLIVAAASILVNKKNLPEMAAQISADWAVVLVTGLVLFVAGLAIVRVHNVWDGGWWTVLVTVLGWLTLVGGAARVLYPRQLAAMAPGLVASPLALTLGGYALLVLGACITLKAFRLLD